MEGPSKLPQIHVTFKTQSFLDCPLSVMFFFGVMPLIATSIRVYAVLLHLNKRVFDLLVSKEHVIPIPVFINGREKNQ
jgi:hypothetical protein